MRSRVPVQGKARVVGCGLADRDDDLAGFMHVADSRIWPKSTSRMASC